MKVDIINDMADLDVKTLEYQRQRVKDSFNKCTPKQQRFFIRIYGEVDLIEKDKIDEAYSIIQRTLKKNGVLKLRNHISPK